MDSLKKFALFALFLWGLLLVLDIFNITGWFLLPYTGFKNRNDSTFSDLNTKPDYSAGTAG